MSKASDIHQHYLDRLAAVLPSGYSRLSNPYKAEENADILLKQGYGVTIGKATNVAQTSKPKVLIRREFGIVLTRQYIARDDDGATKAEMEKQLIEDAALIQADLHEKFSQAGLFVLSKWLGDSGVQYVATSTERFLKTEIEFQVDYFEGTA
jgi:hypothetical protein